MVEVYTGGLTGEGNARNVGIRSATASHIAYLDDDDIWLPHHLKMAVRSLQGPAGPDVYSCSAIVAHPDEARIAPKVRYTGHRPLIDFFYGAWSWAGRERSIPTQAGCFEGNWASSSPWTRLSLPARTCGGCCNWRPPAIRYGNQVPLERSGSDDPARTASRATPGFLLEWAHRLESLRSGAGRRFLVHTVGRRLARAGDTAEWRKLMDVVDDQFRLTPGERTVRALEAILLEARPRSAASQ